MLLYHYLAKMVKADMLYLFILMLQMSHRGIDRNPFDGTSGDCFQFGLEKMEKLCTENYNPRILKFQS